MRKKATYWGIALSLALGVATVTATSALPSFFSAAAAVIDDTEAVDEGDTEAEPDILQVQTVSPANGSTISTDGGLWKISLTYNCQDLFINREMTDAITVSKDGKVIESFNAGSRDNVVYGKDNYTIDLVLPTPCTEAGTYVVNVPKGLGNIGKDASASDGETTTTMSAITGAETLTFKVVEPFHWSVNPGQGTSHSELNKFVVTFPDATAITLTSDYDLQDQAALQFVKGSAATDVSLFNISVEQPNKLVLECVDPYSTPVQNNDEYCRIALPEGLVSLTIKGQPVESQALTIGRFTVNAFPTSAIKCDLVGAASITPSKVADFYLDFEGLGEIDWVGNNNTIVYLRPVIGGAIASDVAYASYKVTKVSETEARFHFVMKNADSATSTLNNPALWESAECYLCFPKTTFGRTIKDVSYDNLPFNFGPVNLKANIDAAAAISPANNAVLDPTEGLKSIRLTFVKNMQIREGEVNIYKDGSTTPMATYDVSNIAGFVNGNRYDINLKIPAIKEVGKYRVVIAAKAFRQTADAKLYSGQIVLNYTITDGSNLIVSPAPYSLELQGSDLEVIKITYPDVESITLNSDETVVYGVIGGSGETIKSNSNRALYYLASVDGNTVTLTYDAAKSTITIPATAAQMQGKNLLSIWIQGGEWTLNYAGGSSNVNTAKTIYYGYGKYPEPTISLSSTAVMTADDFRKGFTLTAPEGYIFSQVAADAPATMFQVSPTGQFPGLLTATTDAPVFAEFYGKISEDRKTATYSFSSSYSSAINGMPTGEYLIKFSPDAISYGYYKTSTDDEGNETTTLESYEDMVNAWYYPVQVSGVTTVELQSDVRGTYETFPLQTPEDHFVIYADGYEISYLKNSYDKWYMRRNVGGTYTNAKPLIADFKDGKIYLSLSQANIDYYKGLGFNSTFQIVNGNAVGTYKQEVLANIVTLTNKAGVTTSNEAMTLTFTVTGAVTNPEYTIYPGEGTLSTADIPEGIKTVTLSYPKNLEVAVNGAANGHVLVYKEGVSEAIETLGASDIAIDANKVVLTLKQALVDGGKYTVIFPRNFFTYGQLKTPSNEISVVYTIESMQPAVIGSVVPADGSVISGFEGVTLLINEPTEITKAEAAGKITLSYSNPLDKNAQPKTLALQPYLQADRASVLLTIDEATEDELRENGEWPISVSGEYNVIIDENAIVFYDLDGVQYGIEAQTLTYDVIRATPATVKPLQGSYVSELKDFTVTFYGNPVVKALGNIDATVTFSGSQLPSTAEVKDGAIVVTLNTPATAAGSYTLSIPAKSVALAADANAAGTYNSAVNYTFTMGAAPELTNIFPADQKQINFFTNVNLTFNYAPSANRAVTAKATVKRDGAVAYELGNRSAQCQYAPEGDVNSVIMNFANSEQDRTPGRYVVDIPEGFFLLGGQIPSPAIHTEYTIADAAKTIITPTPNSSIKKFEKLTFRFPDAEKIEFDPAAVGSDNEKNPFMAISTTFGYSSNIVSYNVDQDRKMVEVYFNPCDTVGKYSVNIPGAAFSVWENGAKCTQIDKVYQYYISEIDQPSLNPAPGIIKKDALSGNLILSLPKGNQFSMMIQGTAYGIFRAEADGTRAENAKALNTWYFDKADNGGKLVSEMDPKPNSIVLTNSTPGFTLSPGNYVIELRGSTLFVETDPYEYDGSDEGSATFNYFVVGEPFFFAYTVIDGDLPEIKPELTPAPGEVSVSQLNNITLAYTNFEAALVNNYDCRLERPDTYLDKNGEEVPTTKIVYLNPSAVSNVVTFTPESELDMNNWKLIIPAGTIGLVYGNTVLPATAIEADYVCSSRVSELFDGELLDVYTMTGLCVLRGATAEDFARLEEGLYIVNGKKIYLRK